MRSTISTSIIFPERARSSGQGSALRLSRSELPERRPHHSQHPQRASRSAQSAPGFADGDRSQLLLQNVFLGTGQIGRSVIDTRLTWAYNPAVDYEKLYAYDPKRAASLLDEAGLKPGPDGVRFGLRLSFDTGRPEYTPLAQALQRYWLAVGIKTTLEGAERPVVLKRVYSDYVSTRRCRTIQPRAIRHSAFRAPTTAKRSSRGKTLTTPAVYSNPEVDALFDQGRDAADRSGAQSPLFQGQEVLAHDLPVLTIHQQAQIGASRACSCAINGRPRSINGGTRYGWRSRCSLRCEGGRCRYF